MKLLLDTHTFLWFINGNDNLSTHARSLIEDPTNDRFLSLASLWEMAIKVSLQRLTLQDGFTELVATHVHGNAMKILPVSTAHLDRLKTLPFHHRDPFDRLIIAQSLTDDIPILGKDNIFSQYGAALLWTA